MEKWYMIWSGIILDTCIASSKEEADKKFQISSGYNDWSESKIISKANYEFEEREKSKARWIKI